MRKLLLFLLLLALGFGALAWLTADGAPLPRPALVGGKRQENAPAPTGQGVTLRQDGIPATFSQTGPLDIVRWREVREEGGRIRKEEAFVLRAADSRPLGEGRQQLDGVVVTVFDAAKTAATLRARQAFVALQPDGNGRPSVDEGKDLDLRDVEVLGAPDGELAGFTLRLATATARITDEAVVLTAPDDAEVLAEVAGDQPLTLRGFGLRAELPRDRDGSVARADVTIRREPVVVADDVTVRARGALRFVDEPATGGAELTLQDEVELTSARALPIAGAPTVGDAGGGLVVRADRFAGRLARAKSGERRQAAWQRMELTGAPVVVTMPEGKTTPAGKLRTPRLTAWPNAYGELAWLTAHGGESRLDQTTPRRSDRRRDDGLLMGVSEKRIHFVSPHAVTGAHLRRFGFPRWTLRPLEQLQAVVVEGRATIRNDRSLATAQDGVRLYRREGCTASLLRGLGAARVEQRGDDGRDLLATCADGFTLAERDGVQRAQIGPEAPTDGDPLGAWARNAFTLRHGDADVAGNGVATIVQRGDAVELAIQAPDASIVATLPTAGLALRGAHRADARFVDGRPVAFDAGGWPLELLVDRGGERIAAQAARLLQIGPGSVRLLPPDPARPALWRALPAGRGTPTLRRSATDKDGAQQELEVGGPSIDVHHAGGRAVIVDALAVGDDLPQLHARLQQRADEEPTTLACAAQRLRLLPFAAPALARERLLGGEHALGVAMFRGAGSTWLLAEAVREFTLDDPRQGHVEGHGARLLVNQSARAAMFFGDPDAAVAAEVTRVHAGRTTTLRGARVRVVDGVGGGGDGGSDAARDVRLDALGAFDGREAFLPPTLTLHEHKRTGLLAHMQAACQGAIAVRSDAVDFAGPVAARGLLPDGALDPRGLRLDARTLRLLRDLASGELVAAEARGVDAGWSDMAARCAALDLDLRWSKVVAADPADAVVQLRDGRELRAPRIEVNYATQSARMSSGRMTQRDLAGADGGAAPQEPK